MTKKEKDKLIKLTKYSLEKYKETYRLLFEHEPKVSLAGRNPYHLSSQICGMGRPAKGLMLRPVLNGIRKPLVKV